MSHPVFTEVVDLATPIMVLARGGIVFIKQENHTIILTDTAVEQLSEVLMRAGATSIRVRRLLDGPTAPRRTLPADNYVDPLSTDASQSQQPKESPVPGDAGSSQESTS